MADETTNQPSMAEKVDINDLNLQFEPLEGFDPDKDQFASIPLVADGTYRAKLKQKNPSRDIDSLWIKKQTKQGKPYLATAISAEIISSGPFEGYFAFDNFVSTLVMERTGTIRAAGVLKAIAGSVRVGSAGELAKALTDALAGEPVVGIVTEQRAYCKACEKEFHGQKRLTNGNGQPISGCPKCGGEISVDVRIKEYLSADAIQQ